LWNLAKTELNLFAEFSLKLWIYETGEKEKFHLIKIGNKYCGKNKKNRILQPRV
jgi:hypothetical protein